MNAAVAAGRGGVISLSNSAPAGAAPAPGRGGAPGQALDIQALARQIDPAQAAAMATQLRGQLQGALASLPPELANDPRAAAALGALQNGDAAGIAALIGQFQGAAGAGAGGVRVLQTAPGVFTAVPGVPVPAGR